MILILKIYNIIKIIIIIKSTRVRYYLIIIRNLLILDQLVRNLKEYNKRIW